MLIENTKVKKLKQANKDTKDYQKANQWSTEENAIVSPYKLEDEIPIYL